MTKSKMIFSIIFITIGFKIDAILNQSVHFPSTDVITSFKALSNALLAPINGLKNLQSVPFYIKRQETNTEKRIKGFGYPVESYSVTTKDGYILTVHRIPFGKSDKQNNESYPPVLLVHGIFGNSVNFIANANANQNLATVLADEGFDVWIADLRGNGYSQKHTRLSPGSSDYWNFSWQEVAFYDVPAFIDFILDKTGQSKLSYVAHSMGTTVAFAMLSTNISYNEKINVFIAMAPVCTIAYSTNLIARVVPEVSLLRPVLKTITNGKIIPGIEELRKVASAFCLFGILDVSICQTVFELIISSDINNFNKSQLPFILSIYPDSTSLDTVLLYGQGANSKTFQMFDYGKEENLQIYNQVKPPVFKIENVSAPVAIISSDNDYFAVPEGVKYLRQHLPNIIFDYKIATKENFNHYDFIFAQNANKVLYKVLVNQLKK